MRELDPLRFPGGPGGEDQRGEVVLSSGREAPFEGALLGLVGLCSKVRERDRARLLRSFQSLPIEGHDELELSYGGEPLEIGFNATYLLEVLRYMPSDEVRMTFKAPERAATLEPSLPEGDDEAMDYLCLVMPLRLLD